MSPVRLPPGLDVGISGSCWGWRKEATIHARDLPFSRHPGRRETHELSERFVQPLEFPIGGTWLAGTRSRTHENPPHSPLDIHEQMHPNCFLDHHAQISLTPPKKTPNKNGRQVRARLERRWLGETGWYKLPIHPLSRSLHGDEKLIALKSSLLGDSQPSGSSGF